MGPRKDPIVYEIGKDISQEQFNELVIKIGDWFSQGVRKVKEPNVAARQALERCLKGLKSNDKPWYAAWNMSLANRIKTMCRYDMEKMEPIFQSSPKRQKKRERDDRSEKRRKERARELDTPVLTDAERAALPDAKYGEDPRRFFTEEEEREWRRIRDDYTRQFPHLTTINAQAELAQLCDLHILQARLRSDRNSQRRQFSVSDAADMVKELENLKKALGIHPTQIKTKTDKLVDVSIAAAAARLDPSVNEDYRKLRVRFFLEEALQSYQMFHTKRADGQGYQLDEAGLFALHRCHTCECSHCGTKNFSGFAVDDIERILIERGLIEPLESVALNESTGFAVNESTAQAVNESGTTASTNS